MIIHQKNLELKLVIEETERLLETEFTNISANDVNQLLTELEEQKIIYYY